MTTTAPPRVALRPGRTVLLASVLALFVELALIRWIPNTIHVVAFFANLVLIAAFLGLGIGMAKPSEPAAAAKDAALRLALLVVGAAALGLTEPSAVLDPGADYAVNETRSGLAVPLAVVLLGVFAVTTWSMVPFGRLVAARFDALDRIHAYSINIGGSLAGVVAFAFLSWLGAPPWVWFAGVFALLAVLGAGRRLVLPVLAVGVGLLVGFIHDSATFTESVSWSPYYKLRVHSLDPAAGPSGGFVVDVNNQFLLSGLDLRPEAEAPATVGVETARGIQSLKSYYDFPFDLGDHRRVLILGSGAGNDIAAALRQGVQQVTAVEIDPEVLRLGDQHPERPYADRRVVTVLDDARAFLRRTDRQYDLILFATLDAHGLLSSVGSLRLDSFVYTRESLEAAKSHLTGDGILVLSFGPFREDVQFRQYGMVQSVFGQDPLYFIHANNHRAIVAGDLEALTVAGLSPEWREIGREEIEEGFRSYPHAALEATDDWPHLYVRDRGIPREYLVVLLGIAAIAAFLVRGHFRGDYRVDAHFLFLGAGFLLMETKSVTEYALLIGSTWLTNALVFTVILAVILLVNLTVLRGWLRIPVGVAYPLLGVALLAQYLFPVPSWAGAGGAGNLTLATLYLGVPILLASYVFASTFRLVALGTAALASNLVGSVLGGLSEYLSLAFGLRALSLLALGMYAGSFLSWVRRPALHPA